METLKNILLGKPIILTDAEIAEYKKYRVATGVKTDLQTIDQILYGT